MPKSKAPVVSIAVERKAQQAQTAFLELLHADMSENSECIAPIPASLINRIAHLRAKAQANRDGAELLEG